MNCRILGNNMQDRIKRIRFKGSAETRDAALLLLHDAGDTALMERDRPRFMVMRCPCGCGENLFANLDSRAGPAWRLYRRRSVLTLFPSYWREDACESHFIIWDDRIFWCDVNDTFWEVDPVIREIVFNSLPSDQYVNYVSIADQLDVIPWEVLQVCRRLQSENRVLGNKGRRSTAFKRR
jgi:hypothetical protein